MFWGEKDSYGQCGPPDTLRPVLSYIRAALRAASILSGVWPTLCCMLELEAERGPILTYLYTEEVCGGMEEDQIDFTSISFRFHFDDPSMSLRFHFDLTPASLRK